MARGKKTYPWVKWLARKKLTLVRGKDYQCQPHSMGQQFRNEALKAQLVFSIHIDGGTLTIVRKD